MRVKQLVWISNHCTVLSYSTFLLCFCSKNKSSRISDLNLKLTFQDMYDYSPQNVCFSDSVASHLHTHKSHTHRQYNDEFMIRAPDR